MKSKPCGFGEEKSVHSPISANFIAQAISSAKCGFIPSGRTDFIEKSTQTGAFFMAGVVGFEPANAGVKVLCLTIWRYPYEIRNERIITQKAADVKDNAEKRKNFLRLCQYTS